MAGENGNDLFAYAMALGFVVHVYLDGKLVDHVGMADEAAGEVERAVTANGKLVVVDDEIQVETLRGAVRCELVSRRH